VAHAIQNVVYGGMSDTCLYNQTKLLAPFGGFEGFTDCMAQAMTGSTAYLWYRPGGCSSSELTQARKVLSGQKL